MIRRKIGTDREAPTQQSTRRRGKIVNLLLVVMLIVGTIPLIISGYNLISYNANILARDQQVMHLQICKSVAGEIKLFLQSCFNTLTPLQKSLELNFDPGNPQRIFYDSKTRQLLNSIFESNNRIINIRSVYKEGRGVEAGYLITDESPLGGELRKAFYYCLENGFTYVSRPQYSDQFKQVVIIIGNTVLLNNKVQGIITVVFSMTDIDQSIQSLSSTNTVFLMDSQGRVILHPDMAMKTPGTDLSQGPIFKEMKKLKSHAISTFPFVDDTTGKSVPMVGTVYMIPETQVDWGVVVETPEAVANLDIQKMQLQTLYWIIFSILLALIMSVLFSQRISTPIRALAAKTLSISQGNFAERVNVRSRNELGILADNFNRMAVEIEDYIDQLKRAAEENRELFIGAIRTLTAAIDAKDPYTRGHSERVTQYAVLIAREMGLSERDLERVYLGALLHDVGKIGISDAILQKPGMLTDTEFSVMKLHPELGGDIMSQIPQLREVLPGMRHHHESLDGSGYPHGLVGDEIPLDARIIGVADAFDAMTTERPYQKPFSIEEALKSIRARGGTKFDLRVIAALESAYHKGLIHLPDQQEIKKPRYIKSM